MEVELAEVRQTFETNLFAVIAMCQTFLPLLIKAKGTIVQIGSVAGVSLRYVHLCRSHLTDND
jgi:Short-chain dehydrogenases of various substrate specificities